MHQTECASLIINTFRYTKDFYGCQIYKTQEKQSPRKSSTQEIAEKAVMNFLPAQEVDISF